MKSYRRNKRRSRKMPLYKRQYHGYTGLLFGSFKRKKLSAAKRKHISNYVWMAQGYIEKYRKPLNKKQKRLIWNKTK